MHVSIIIGYRNKEPFRVKNCLESLANQTFNDFELVFIDYGSNEIFSCKIKELVESYSFARYYYNNTKGMSWNRAHALNSGVRLAKNDFILFGDVDLIYSPGVLGALYDQVSEESQVYSTVYFLSEGQTDLATIIAGDWRTIPSSDENGKGGVHLLAKKHLEIIRGYDEYYCFWGVEDRDLYTRLDKLGLKSKWIDNNNHPVFHQWHPISSGAIKGFFPDRWWESMNLHFQVNKNVLKRNSNKWGKLLSNNDRPILSAKEIVFVYRERAKWFYKGVVVSDLIKAIQELNSGECLTIKIDNKIKYVNKKLGLANWIIKPFFPNFTVVSKQFDLFSPQRDLMYIVWRLIKDEQIITDYYISEGKNFTTIKLISNIV